MFTHGSIHLDARSLTEKQEMVEIKGMLTQISFVFFKNDMKIWKKGRNFGGSRER